MTIRTTEDKIADAINVATEEIAGPGKGISHTPLTLVVRKKGVPDLTMVDLPGITRVPVHGQPEDIYEQISDIIMEYISPKESIILNVLSATVDFPTCESIRMSQRVDKTGERTLAVVTKVDKEPEELLEKVTTDAVNIGLGYVCVRNRIGDESYEEARTKEAELFESHSLLSKIDKSIVGIPVLAQKLVQIQAASIAKCLPEIVKKINDKLNQNVDELNHMPQNLATVTDVMNALLHIIGASNESLRKLLFQGEFEEYPKEEKMHCTARMGEMLHHFSNQLYSKTVEDYTQSSNFLVEELQVIEEAKGIRLPNFIPRSVFLVLLQRKVNQIADFPLLFITKMWSYIEDVVVRVVKKHLVAYPQFNSATLRAIHNLLAEIKKKSENHVQDLVEMEKIIDYTSNPEYMKNCASLMSQKDCMMEVIRDASKPTLISLEGFGQVQVGHLRKQSALVEQAFDMKIRVTVYMKIVMMRLVDGLATHLLFTMQKLVDHDMQHSIVNELMEPRKGGIERMLEESPSLSGKRERLNRSTKLLKQSKEVVANIMDSISADGHLE